MYKDIVIKKRVWIEEDRIPAWDLFDEYSEVEFESTIVDFNGRIPVEDGVIVGDWMTNGIQLIKADMGELLSEGEGMIQSVSIKGINNLLEAIKPIPGTVLPIGICDSREITSIKFSNGEYSTAVDIRYFQYIYESNFDYQLFSFNNGDYGLLLKYDGLVCGAVMGMNLHNQDSIWERPYSLADVEALKEN